MELQSRQMLPPAPGFDTAFVAAAPPSTYSSGSYAAAKAAASLRSAQPTSAGFEQHRRGAQTGTLLVATGLGLGLQSLSRRRRRAQLRGSTRLRAAAAAAPSQGKKRPRVAVVGAGWGGLGAAKGLCENGCEVILLDGNPDPAAIKPSLTPSGKPFEPGTRGFWKDYPNIASMLDQLGIPEGDVFTDFTESAFYGPSGMEATAPVFGDAAELPSPLGQVIASFSRFERLPLADRLSISGLLAAMIDYTRDEKTFAAYDRMTAHELFVRAGLSQRLVDDFLRPTLLVGLFKPPEELSAAVTMELLYFYALAHQTSFDVRWLRRGTVAETLVRPLVSHLDDLHALDVRGSHFVSSLVMEKGKITGLQCKTPGGGESTIENLDGVVLALGSGGMRAVMAGSPEVARRCPTLAAAGGLKGVDVMSCRLWLDTYVDTRTPANVLSKFEGLRGAGGTFFMLDQLQPDHDALWGGEEPRGSVVACDFYNAGALLALSDEEIVRLLSEELLPAAVPQFRSAKVVDSYVKGYPGAVTWFSPGSYRSRPTLETPIENLVCAGDWVRLGSREHGAKGLCQERAYVTGLEAANSLARRGVLGGKARKQHEVLAVRPDEPQVVAGRAVNKAVTGFLESLGAKHPWVR
eukprot:TRINITY_DN112643_c0_g1_i1.p1 TRINITY_DN112643_c0_g1~~TRINITY_DN112643_c0_g1_i1.p1  ORF type:complete len:634 (-),score=128.10 TRINITY_DN112643_c0_g1_i1:77-1978(-)